MRAVPLNRYFAFFLIAGGGLAARSGHQALVFRLAGHAGRADPLDLDPSLWLSNEPERGCLIRHGAGDGLALRLAFDRRGSGDLLVALCHRGRRQWLLTVALAGIMAGVLGNLYDRLGLGLPGVKWTFENHWHKIGDPIFAVRDWILVMIGPFHWPNFNIADSLLVCGALLLVWHAFFQKDINDGKTTT